MANKDKDAVCFAFLGVPSFNIAGANGLHLAIANNFLYDRVPNKCELLS